MIESGLFKGMTEADATFLVFITILFSIFILAILLFYIKDKIDTHFWICHQPEEYEEKYDNFLAFPCPCCRSNNVQMIVTIKFGNITSYKKKITFYEDSTKLSYKIKCQECGIQTENNQDLSKTILDWNGKSQSTEIIKKEN